MTKIRSANYAGFRSDSHIYYILCQMAELLVQKCGHHVARLSINAYNLVYRNFSDCIKYTLIMQSHEFLVTALLKNVYNYH